MLTFRRAVGITSAATIALVSITRPSSAHTGIEVEAVNIYGDGGAGSGSLTHEIASCTNMQSGIVGIDGYTNGGTWENANVWDTDFYDPDSSGYSFDDDTYNFDDAENVISMYCGHGYGLYSNISLQGCNTASDCSSTPPTGWSGPASCVAYPGVSASTGSSDIGICRYWYPHAAVVNGSVVDHADAIFYGYGPYGVRFGESSYSGTWGGAGENGGINLAIAEMSFGAFPNAYWDQFNGLFAGLHIWGTMMPVSGDSADTEYPGQELAAAFIANEYSSVGESWAEFVEQNDPGTDGLACGTSGGYHGFNGCGCYLSMSVDNSAAAVAFHVTSENWNALQNDGFDATGNGYYQYYYWCNYDLTTYPINN